MNRSGIILDGLAMSLLFNTVAGVGFLLWQQAYSTMFPKEIRKAAAPYADRRDVRKMHLILSQHLTALPERDGKPSVPVRNALRAQISSRDELQRT